MPLSSTVYLLMKNLLNILLKFSSSANSVEHFYRVFCPQLLWLSHYHSYLYRITNYGEEMGGGYIRKKI